MNEFRKDTHIRLSELVGYIPCMDAEFTDERFASMLWAAFDQGILEKKTLRKKFGRGALVRIERFVHEHNIGHGYLPKLHSEAVTIAEINSFMRNVPFPVLRNWLASRPDLNRYLVKT